MSNSKKIFIALLIIICFIFIKTIFPFTGFLFTNWFISPFTYALLTFIIIKLFPRNYKNREAKIKRKTMFILTAFYLIIFLMLGLLVDFTRNPYWGKIFLTIKDLLSVGAIIILKEIIRNKLVKSAPNKKIYYVLIVLTFFIWQLDMRNISVRITQVDFLLNDVLIALFIQGFLTFVSYDAGIDSVLVNLLLKEFIFHITPVYPDIDWFFLGMYNLLMYIIFYFIIKYESVSLDRWIRRGVLKKENPLIYVFLLSLLILIVCFQLSFFKYYPTAIVTNSMVPIFSRGDAVIIKKIDEKDILKLQIDDIIEYKLGNRSVVHRIIEIDWSDEENPLFITKGDNNNGPDAVAVEGYQIQGTVTFSIPFIGYPSVYFIEFFDGSRPDVETGD